MQHISPSWHCGRNTRRGPSHRLKTNYLCLAALFLLALMPSTGWAQTRVSVKSAQSLREELERDGDVIIDIDTTEIILFKGHITTSGNYQYNSLYRVARGKKTINGKNHIIRRGTTAEEKYYENSSIVLEPGAHLVINNLTLDGKDAPNYASMVVVPPKIKKTTKNGSSSTTSEYTVNAKLEMTNCTIQNCLQQIVTETELTAFHNTQVSSLNAYNYEAFASTSNSGGAGVHFAPGKEGGTNDNTISLNGCIFKANKIQERTQSEIYENAGALALAGGFARGGTIEGCKFQQNYARSYGGAIWFAGNLSQSYPFQFLGTTLVDGNESKRYGGGIVVQGGRVTFEGTVDITNNTTTGVVNTDEGLGGGIFISGGQVTFTKKVTISNNTALRGGGICQNDGTLEITSNNTPSQTIKIENNTATVTPQNTQYNSLAELK